MKRTRICDLLGIEYPIIQGGMTLIAGAELAAAVSNAGALGIISANAGAEAGLSSAENLRNLIRKAKSLTDKPFGVNIPLGGRTTELIDVVIEEGVGVVTTSMGSPAPVAKRFQEAGIKMLHLVASARHARRAEEEGVNAVIAEGYEAGGHNGLDELPTFVLVPSVVDAVQIPVVAAGGIADARGLVAALALGAEGVQIGTRFIATHECLAHPNFKRAVVEAIDTSTVITGRKVGPTRTLRNELSQQIQEMESRGASREELLSFIGAGQRTRQGQIEGDVTQGEAYCGAIAGIVREIVSAAEVVESIVKGVSGVVAGLQ